MRLFRYRSHERTDSFRWILFLFLLPSSAFLLFLEKQTRLSWFEECVLTMRTDKYEASHLTSLNRCVRISIGVVTFILKQLCPLCVSLPMLSGTEQMRFSVLFQLGLSSVPGVIWAQRGKWEVLWHLSYSVCLLSLYLRWRYCTVSV